MSGPSGERPGSGEHFTGEFVRFEVPEQAVNPTTAEQPVIPPVPTDNLPPITGPAAQPISREELLDKVYASRQPDVSAPQVVPRPAPVLASAPHQVMVPPGYQVVPVARGDVVYGYPPEHGYRGAPRNANLGPIAVVAAAAVAVSAMFVYQARGDAERTTASAVQVQTGPSAAPTASPTKAKSRKKPKSTAGAAAPVAPTVAAEQTSPSPRATALTKEQRRQLALFIPKSIACKDTDPVVSLDVHSRMNINVFYRFVGSNARRVGTYTYEGKTITPQGVLNDGVDVRVCAPEAAIQQAITVNANTGVINVNPGLLVRPSFRRSDSPVEATAAHGTGLFPPRTWWSNMDVPPQKVPQYTRKSVETANITVNEFAESASTVRTWAFYALKVNTLREINGADCMTQIRAAVERRIGEIVAQQAQAQHVEKYSLHIGDHFSLSQAYYDNANLRRWHVEPKAGMGYGYGKLKYTCNVIGSSNG